MNIQKLVLMLLMSVMFGQSVFASVDMHIVFEQTDTHHQHDHLDGVNLTEEDHSDDNCGHCCHAHCSNMFMTLQNHISFLETRVILASIDDGSDYFYRPDPALRPPIA